MNSSTKKYLPFIGLLVLVIVFLGGVFVIRKINQPVVSNIEEEESVPDLTEDQWPVVALIPGSDGHTLTLKVMDIKVKDAKSMDYELLYKADNGQGLVTQGVPGSIQLNGQTTIERSDILLGSESSGKKRYDKGVENGTLTLRFRNGSGKLLGKVASDWHLQTGTTTLTSVNGEFKYVLSKAATGVWFITIKPFGTPKTSDVVVFSNGWAIYASDGKAYPGMVQ